VVGTNDGVVIVKQREAAARPDIGVTSKKKVARSNTYNYFNRGANSTADSGDFTFQNENLKPKLKEFDKALKAFRYADALDAALATKQPQIVIAVLEALIQRRGLNIAIGERDEFELEQILAFTARYAVSEQRKRGVEGGSVERTTETRSEAMSVMQRLVASLLMCSSYYCYASSLRSAGVRTASHHNVLRTL